LHPRQGALLAAAAPPRPPRANAGWPSRPACRSTRAPSLCLAPAAAARHWRCVSMLGQRGAGFGRGMTRTSARRKSGTQASRARCRAQRAYRTRAGRRPAHASDGPSRAAPRQAVARCSLRRSASERKRA
jgi:hypothetical protein